ncbi:hypothetical protein [Streptomyces sp. NPDC049040]|uniref:hypothetical protein n=1 Tax=Streptomyces sp. NPDC049040 TaxID=3365593 RepID=UPI00371785AD
MIFVVSMLVALAATIGVCSLILRRAGGSGERGSLERAAAAQALAQGMSAASAARQNTGPGGGA